MLCNRGRSKEGNVKFDVQKSTRLSDINANVVKANTDIYLKDLTALTDVCLESGVFPYEVKLADESPIYKKDKKKKN